MAWRTYTVRYISGFYEDLTVHVTVTDRTEIYCPGFPVITVEDEARLYETWPVADLLRVALLT